MSITGNIMENRIAAFYASRDEVYQAYVILKTKLGLGKNSLKIVAPDDPKIGTKLEGQSSEIGKEMLSKHAKYTISGVLVGMIIATLLVEFGPALFSNSPVFTFIALMSPSIFIGAFIAGLRSLKPEHDTLNLSTTQATQKGMWTLLVHTETSSVDKTSIIEEIKRTKCEKLHH